MIKEEIYCRICGGSLVPVLDLGEIYPSAFVEKQEGLQKAPLVLAQCILCHLTQLKHTVDLDEMYRQYWYKSSLNKSMMSSLEDVAKKAQYFKPLKGGDTVVDIGCNDGTLFKFFPKGCFKIGFDPAENLAEEAEKNCDLFINDYFRSDLLPLGAHKKAKIITSIAMFYDLPAPHEFIEDVKSILADDGIWVIQFTDLVSMFKVNAFDNICHEHLEYYTLRDIVKLMGEHKLEVNDVSYNLVNGGSIRVYVQHKTPTVYFPNVAESLEKEYDYLKSFENPFESFRKRMNANKLATKDWLLESKEKGLRTYVLGASTKGNTLLQIWGLDKTDFPYALEVNKDKFGLYTVGSDIPIISERDGLGLKPDQLFVLPWHFINNLKGKLGDYGGKLVTPLPNFAIHYEEEG